ncbi:TetR/AcrR family transcriptional regulator [Nocardia sp. NBC_00511]|uniref:TetR/AcrR family transcriptional regulator n=1 Tax=Nocardia sp. NBC_00511 TaxID=2903591 RepID=UPI0030E4A84C
MQGSATDSDITDKRLLRGARTRQLALARAVHIASLESLEGLSFGRIATDIGLSKAGLQTLFRTKGSLQLATIDHARAMFADFVVRPTAAEPRGLPRFRALIERWIAYAEQPLFDGGCFQSANLAQYDSRPGEVRDKLAAYQTEWVATLSEELSIAIAQGEIEELDPELAAFQIDAVLRSGNTALRLGDATVIAKIRRVIEAVLHSPGS